MLWEGIKEAARMTRMIAIDIGKCTGCGTCELMCSFRHHGEFNPRKARIRKTVFLFDELAVPVVCAQCEDAWCERICPSGAIARTLEPNSGASVVRVDEQACVGCKMCMLACPFGNIVVGDQGRAEKCDLCDGDPQCVKFCARGALHFVDSEQSTVERRSKVAAQLAVAYREGD
jgi:Fe-S-cluster-containing hydrogenase component 2